MPKKKSSAATPSPTPAASPAAASAAPPAPTPKKKPSQPQRAPSQPQPSLDSTLDDVNRVMTWVATRLMQNCGMVLALGCAYRIRLHAVNNYGKVIHEFDPWFNYRATEYLLENGATKFFNWYDDKRYVTVFKKAVQKASQPPPTLLFFYFFPFPTASIFTQPTATYFTLHSPPQLVPWGGPSGPRSTRGCSSRPCSCTTWRRSWRRSGPCWARAWRAGSKGPRSTTCASSSPPSSGS